MSPFESVLCVRRSIHIHARPAKIWRAFETLEAMRGWWGLVTGDPQAGTSQGQWLDAYEPRVGGAVHMAVMMDGARTSYGGPIRVFEPRRELTFENDWIPNQGWAAPTRITLLVSEALDGANVKFFHYGFEDTGGDVAATHEAYEQGWGMTQLSALKRQVEAPAR